jgi:hypothetical protein
MAETIDWRPTRKPRRRGHIFLIAALAAIVLGAGTLVSYYVEALWFESLGYAEVSGRRSASGRWHSADLSRLIANAGRDLADYQRLTAEGKLGDAGQKLEHLKNTLEELDKRRR